ncbi:spore cortex-lytic enzyme [Brevibacillus fulvus]|uniref:Spore cortex-lytic enzyme n=1 Tax=Brevibacillus fulvus TaxID=1125967 RepID=A0A939BU45_9BACL|nr:spore cortex-lytic enzyme [Brevibacillus fulvus]MBM7589126.1 N-acetylmuramoyl-L-alanine amidase [Brevibacillus fulvus]
MKKWQIITCLFMLLAMITVQPVQKADAAAYLAYGTNSGEVWDLQYRLQLLGFFHSKLDGVYGKQTVNAVKRFQKQYGLPADGIVGAQTWSKLKQHSVNAKEMEMLAHLVYGEARGESYKGQVAVAAVVMNRLQSSKFPPSISGIIFQPGAFTAVDDGQYWLTPDKTAYKAAWDAARGWDPTYGATYYFNPATATSKWIWSRPQITTIGRHIFAA